MVTAAVALLGFVALMALALLAAVVQVRSESRAQERARIEREAAVAAWRVHELASQAFAAMLQEARTQQGEQQ